MAAASGAAFEETSSLSGSKHELKAVVTEYNELATQFNRAI